ncbi:MAG: hypothetical protein H7A37_09445 [Chlamydiales bacterium]|nr:hypothetical protein [Chlamydiia bacterium]MCP5508501.1 hypothetical protein [Chlamydiales bacterium]
MITTENMCASEHSWNHNTLIDNGQSIKTLRCGRLGQGQAETVAKTVSILYLIEGQGDLYYGNQKKELMKKGCYFLPKKEEYRLESVSKVALRYLLIESNRNHFEMLDTPSLLIRWGTEESVEYVEPGIELSTENVRLPLRIRDHLLAPANARECSGWINSCVT